MCVCEKCKKWSEKQKRRQSVAFYRVSASDNFVLTSLDNRNCQRQNFKFSSPRCVRVDIACERCAHSHTRCNLSMFRLIENQLSSPMLSHCFSHKYIQILRQINMMIGHCQMQINRSHMNCQIQAMYRALFCCHTARVAISEILIAQPMQSSHFVSYTICTDRHEKCCTLILRHPHSLFTFRY